MTSTLAKYVDEENIPKKYGGKLDWKFGDMPNLDPSIANGMKWEEDIMQKGHRTFPIGPIRLKYDAAGDLEVTAIGTEDGKPRQRVIAHLPAKTGVAMQALSAGRLADQPLPTVPLSTATAPPTTNATHTASEPVGANGEQKRGTEPNADLDTSKNPDASLPDSSQAG